MFGLNDFLSCRLKETNQRNKGMCISQSSPEREREIYLFKELAQIIIMVPGKSKSYRADRQGENSGNS